ncbi:MAG: UDP-galactose-lipid carrier transferase [Ilumatobacteraceae bacterium]|nr:UDP-galactose-lipid carrier transferase [Acidimicrobiales bacterium]MCB9393183.1 UDP-galactose-lipid carrier transferase [Acidimicrobiaceae bacterium]
MSVIDKLDLSLRLDREQYEKRLAEEQRRLLQLRLHLGGEMGGQIGPGLLVLFEGPDAAGKGGAIKVIVGHLDPRHYTVVNYAAPTPREKRHHFLWRFYRELPGHGGMAVFDRSWYGRVLVERIEGFATKAEWGRAYESIVDFEKSLVTEGIILVKFWMHISDDEQMERFQARAADPLKRWKLTDEDWRNREKNRLYEAAAEDMFAKTSHKLSPWEVIPAEQKRYGRIAVLETLNRRIEEGMKRWGMPVPAMSDLDVTDD